MNLLHALPCKNYSPVLRNITIEEFIDQLGLLTTYEAQTISVTDDTHRDAALCLLGGELSDFFESEDVNHRFDRDIYKSIGIM